MRAPSLYTCISLFTPFLAKYQSETEGEVFVDEKGSSSADSDLRETMDVKINLIALQLNNNNQLIALKCTPLLVRKGTK